MCTFGVLGLSCETPAASKAAKMGAKREGTIPREDPQIEREKERKWERERGKKKARNFGPPAFGPSPFEPPRCGARSFGLPTLRTPTLRAGLPTLRATIPPGSTLRPPSSLRAEASGLHFFFVGAPTFLIFIMLLICFFCVHF